MSILSSDERDALRALGRARIKRAEALVNPASGLANDYLNMFNEIVMLVEQLPTMPELFDDLKAWHPMSYQEYFRNSVLPGSRSALDAYDALDARFRRDFETIVEELDRRSTGTVAAVRRHFRSNGDDAALAALCERAGATIREVLERATMLVNHGAIISQDEVQSRTDKLFAKLAADVP